MLRYYYFAANLLVHRKSSNIFQSSICQQWLSLRTFFHMWPNLFQRILTRRWWTTAVLKEWLPSVLLLQFRIWSHHRLWRFFIFTVTLQTSRDVAHQEDIRPLATATAVGRVSIIEILIQRQCPVSASPGPLPRQSVKENANLLGHNSSIPTSAETTKENLLSKFSITSTGAPSWKILWLSGCWLNQADDVIY